MLLTCLVGVQVRIPAAGLKSVPREQMVLLLSQVLSANGVTITRNQLEAARTELRMSRDELRSVRREEGAATRRADFERMRDAGGAYVAPGQAPPPRHRGGANNDPTDDRPLSARRRPQPAADAAAADAEPAAGQGRERERVPLAAGPTDRSAVDRDAAEARGVRGGPARRAAPAGAPRAQRGDEWFAAQARASASRGAAESPAAAGAPAAAADAARAPVGERRAGGKRDEGEQEPRRAAQRQPASKSVPKGLRVAKRAVPAAPVGATGSDIITGL